MRWALAALAKGFMIGLVLGGAMAAGYAIGRVAEAKHAADLLTTVDAEGWPQCRFVVEMAEPIRGGKRVHYLRELRGKEIAGAARP